MNECKYANDECEGQVIFRPDPFAAEIHEDYTKVYMCEYHRQVRAEDI